MVYGKHNSTSFVQSQYQVKWLMANSQQLLFLYSPSIKLNGLWPTHNSSSFCTVPVSSSMAYGKKHFFLHSPNVKLNGLWPTHNTTSFCTVPVSNSKAYGKKHFFLHSPNVKFSGLGPTHNSTSLCTVPVSSSAAYGLCLRKGCNQEAATTAKPGSHVLSLSRWARCSNPACIPR